MVFINAHRRQFLLAGSLAAAVTAFTVTACGGGGAAAPPQGAAPGKWTQAEISQFTAAAGTGGSPGSDNRPGRDVGITSGRQRGERVGGAGAGPAPAGVAGSFADRVRRKQQPGQPYRGRR